MRSRADEARSLQHVGAVLVVVGVALCLSGIHLGAASTGPDGRLHYDGAERAWNGVRGLMPFVGAGLIVLGWFRGRT